MKHLVAFTILIVSCSAALAQTDSTPPPAPPSVKDKFFYGGGLGLSFGDVDYVEIAPLVGYRFLPKLDGGVQPFAYCAYQQAGLFEHAGEPDAAARFVPGEGAALLLLEERDAAIARNAPIRAELVASSSHSATLPDLAATLARTYCDALRSTHWQPDEITTYRIAAPALPSFAEPIARVAARLFPTHRSPAMFGHRLGHALAAAGPIDTALMLAAARSGDRCLSTAVALSGHAATVAFEVA